MGGDHAPGEIVAGAIQAADELDVRVLLVGLEDAITPLLPDGVARRGDRADHRGRGDARPPGLGAHQEGLLDRDQRPSSCATARPTRWSSAGNTGAAMAAALLRMGRIRGRRPARDRGAGPGARARAADPGRRRRDRRLHRRVAAPVRDHGPRVRAVDAWVSTSRASACSRTARRPARATTCARRSTRCSSRCPGFIGNVEGRDFMHDTVDVIVTDGFTGNVALKTVEGAIRGTATLVFEALESTPEVQAAAASVMPALLDGRRAARSRLHRWVHAPRRRRRVRDLARVVERAGDEELGGAGRRECVEGNDRRTDERCGGRCRLRPTWSAARSVPTTCCG